MSENTTLTKKDFASDQEVRWCPGCGDYAILNSIQSLMPTLGIPKEKIVFVSGIGCSSRFPYYMSTYGFHTIHGRAAAIATGLKTINPDLSVWVITGDGDSLSIGGNHFIHAIRRNLDVNIILFNNEIYGLTKGQYSPTSPTGLVTKSSPYGSLERKFSAASLSIGAEATFFARTIDAEPKYMQEILTRAAAHKGTSVVEVLQNCVIFNDGAHKHITDRASKEENQLRLEHGKPMVFGAKRDKGIRLNGITPEVVTLGENGITEADLLVHDERAQEPTLAYFLSRMRPPEFPAPLGVFRSIEAPSYSEQVHRQIEDVREKKGAGDLRKLLYSGDTWEVKEKQ
ncbi:2-oxoacid:ferredoxin oxidoreductase subunit beta [bacterium (Candidatus Blackallbacteria) CG17_big_fil_post_rev_8_21_14_2_50_48_46]|uniref:2-oxoacid:ferredoxin oxidoreductase subunit beta n=1 Tax=bacterium (Candidatus Blackallbacteria) CG17_big_fil_post_rev_8_21_14_2_50_48_46 TaxID=2014261 RepID=A0A2M7G9E3_9BACT|nr:MAG: 2-oxoacid:ferredoxin oxidoreductase subunit beta [bacterium (Candidatus Blackallbacteria) CG18_big_fil_WC_8_21_14_2_50_49_26]PIW18728.1 MAG: 2-oxoacid:ferredoxin oxidoreductase subunit beta [bacterium (Candidatus Blackallbacteria) CG17_big_fil_post_rev_8_21_14_2_50_48_46]PIW46434.1 MAG: 2-oxoacid:ferredoxin oxidoreductase subunit beta [bacterium (Candidatus Blackallbacteria) CG13_big_fil_rev_8_21_14_2_50_49_14]